MTKNGISNLIYLFIQKRSSTYKMRKLKFSKNHKLKIHISKLFYEKLKRSSDPNKTKLM